MTTSDRTVFAVGLATAGLVAVISSMSTTPISAADNQIPVTFTGGHVTESRDGGRPVVLVAGALGVKPEEFREAFRGVTPSRNGPPSPEERGANKAALMKVLAPLGVTNDRLDEVSDYYRYRPQRGELWPTSPAQAYAVVENGAIQKIVVTDGGSGYSSPPQAVVPGFGKIALQVTLQFGRDLKTNGRIGEIETFIAKSSR